MPMASEKLDEKAIFSVARKLDSPHARVEYLHQVCGADQNLFERVDTLLRAYDEQASFLESPLADSAPPTCDQPLLEKPGSQIGPYKLLEQIGEGGFGVVFMAEQERPVRRRVALKIIKPGMDTRQVIGRFGAERQALAMMDHPNIAKVHDAGATENGRPYFVMELVQGVPITEYCDQCNLPTRERLELFVSVCQAVQHAHQKGVIHRDLKPTNVLVAMQDGRPAPKIIDFGVAKAIGQRLTEHTLMTAFAQMVGTPLYMSPEQAELSPLGVDTRSDIYSLGVLLYELLTGVTPFDKDRLHSASYDELRRIIREEEPPWPSARLSSLALRERAGVRETAKLATTVAERRRTDTRRLLQTVRGDLDWIVMKCLDKDRNRRYETANGLAKDIQRHLNDEPIDARRPTAAYRLKKFIRRNKVGVLAGLAIGAALVAGLILASVGFVQARRQSRIATAEAVKSTAISSLLQKALQSANPDGAKGSDYTVRQLLDDIASNLGNELKDQPEARAAIHATTGNAYRRVGLLDKAEPHLKAALDLRRRIYGANHVEVARSLIDYGWILHERQEQGEAEARAREALAIHRKLGLQNSETVEILSVLQLFLNDRYNYQEGEAIAQEALAIARQLAEPPPDLANVLHRLAGPTIVRGDLIQGERLARESLALHRQLHGDNHPETAWGLFHVAWALRRQKRYDEAEAYYREALAIFRKHFDEAHSPVLQALEGLRTTLTAKGDEAALKRLNSESAFRLSEAIERNDTDAGQRLRRGQTYRSLGKLQQAEEDFSRAIELNPKASENWLARGELYADQKQWEKSEADLANAVKHCSTNPYEQNLLAWALATRIDPGARQPQAALDLAKQAVAGAPADANLWNTLGVAQFRAGDWQAAIDALNKSMELRNYGDGIDWFFLAMAHWKLDNKDEARKWYEKALEWMEKTAPGYEQLIRFRGEAEELMGIAPTGTNHPTTDAETPTAAENENQKPPTTND